ncbi:MAG: hypothetical protein ACRDJ4_02135 [Actinomycetota bacterium]
MGALDRAGVPMVKPPGGHAVYIDAKALLPHIPPTEFPAQALAVEIYRAGGVRGAEVGSVMFGRRSQSQEPAAMELVRLAIPRRMYTRSHLDYVADVVIGVAGQARSLRGYRIVWEPQELRHFTAQFEPLDEKRRMEEPARYRSHLRPRRGWSSRPAPAPLPRPTRPCPSSPRRTPRSGPTAASEPPVSEVRSWCSARA